MASSFESLFGGTAALDASRSPAPATGAWFARIADDQTFRPLAHFGQRSATAATPAAPDPIDAVTADALADAEARGRQAALAEMANEGAARAALKLSLQRLDDNLQEELGLRIAETVAALCEHTIAPLAIDRSALRARGLAAAALLREGIEATCLRLHPDDIPLLDEDFAARWPIEADARLERGTLQFDTAEGAVRDGPAEWRAALHEALGLC
ncbi:flagellar biosynthesis protein [Parerythrobacter lacustris]|uniref:Flagellar biosynthesis protein n=1 Tax=Parerythrobacter lacustris TaxID=2969984 RepID=A0ABT1XM85_9SPHN|nr:flagellar biosynthesis protein [Parerythrobacter lacustris]MCR2832780.1 flagellar biosynthesis protein [Parerythrobacter lacustris]